MKVDCPDCGVEHDLADMEPAFTSPDEVFRLIRDGLGERVSGDADVLMADGVTYRRGVLPLDVVGHGRFCIGIWVAMRDAIVNRGSRGLDSPEPVAGVIANALPTSFRFGRTVGVDVELRFPHADQVPEVWVREEGHPLQIAQAQRLPWEDMLEMLHAFV